VAALLCHVVIVGIGQIISVVKYGIVVIILVENVATKLKCLISSRRLTLSAHATQDGLYVNILLIITIIIIIIIINHLLFLSY
jgi:hypothetical protein